MFSCPNCGGNLKFDIPSQQLSCEYCHTQADPYSFEDKAQDSFMQQDFEATIFTCPQCGGEILSTDTSAAEFCSFCGASTILHSRLVKEKRPNYIIPFKQTKEDCKKAYSAMMKKAFFAPDALKNPKYIDSFRGIYMPYWAFYMTQQDGFSLKGTKSYRRGNYVYTDHYALEGDIEAYYKGLSYDASSSFDDNISEKIAPYDVKGMKAFTPAFLSGFYADTADVSSEVYESDATQIARNHSVSQIYQERAFTGYSMSPLMEEDSLNTTTQSVDSTMFPVWFMSYRNAGRVAYATVNGQTGKVVADLPIDAKKYLIGSLILALPIFLLLNLFFTVIPSVLLIISTILALLTCIIYAVELVQLRKKEKGLEDKGRMAKATSGTVQSSTIQKERKDAKKSAGLMTAIAAIVVGIVITCIHPVSDLFYYGGVIFVLLAIFYTIKDIIYYYNILSTRRLPQFDRTGGDDRA